MIRLAKAQLELQLERSQILECALNKKFTLTHSTMRRIAPVAYDTKASDPAPSLDQLIPLDAYTVTITLPSGKKFTSDFKFAGYEGSSHIKKGTRATACSNAQSMEYILDSDIRYKEGGLHYLLDDARLFWGMAICWLAFGTTFPYGPCHCGKKDYSSMDKLQKRWDKILEDAKRDPCSVQCMFWDGPFGCFSADCPFKHAPQ